MNKVSCIISAYNEANSIEEVLKQIAHHNLIGEIIVVDDGSTDTTVEVAEKYTQHVIRHNKNRGKSAAVKSGIKKASYDTLFLLDSDIPNITRKNIEDLLTPVLNKEYDVSLALIGNPMQRLIKVDILSGIRCIRKKHLVDFFSKNNPVGYELEILLNKYILERNLSFRYADWTNSHFKYSTVKTSFLEGLKTILKKRVAIYKKIGFFSFYYQYLQFFLKKNKL